MAGLGFGGLSGVVGPGLRAAPRMGAGEVDTEGAGGAVGGKDFDETVAQLGDGDGESVETGEGGHAGEVEGVAGGVDLAFERGGIFAAEVKGGGG